MHLLRLCAVTLAAFALLGLFALVPVAIRRLRARRDAPPAAR